MRKLLILIVAIISTVMSSCDYMGHVFTITNRADEEITIVWGYKDKRNDSTIILSFRQDALSCVMTEYGILRPNKSLYLDILGGMHVQRDYCDKYIQEECHGLMRMFIVRTRDVEQYGWRKVVEDSLVLQRYDFTDKDLEMIDRQIYFPPTPTMLNINMWPPYDTYSCGYPK